MYQYCHRNDSFFSKILCINTAPHPRHRCKNARKFQNWIANWIAISAIARAQTIFAEILSSGSNKMSLCKVFMPIASVGWFKLNQIRVFFPSVALQIDTKYHSIVVTVVLIKFCMLYILWLKNIPNTISRVNKMKRNLSLSFRFCCMK